MSRKLAWWLSVWRQGRAPGILFGKDSEWIDIVCQERKPQKLWCIIPWDVELLVLENLLLIVEWQGGIHYTKCEYMDLANTAEASGDSVVASRSNMNISHHNPLVPFVNIRRWVVERSCSVKVRNLKRWDSGSIHNANPFSCHVSKSFWNWSEDQNGVRGSCLPFYKAPRCRQTYSKTGK